VEPTFHGATVLSNDHDVIRRSEGRHAVRTAGNVMIVAVKRFRGSVVKVPCLGIE